MCGICGVIQARPDDLIGAVLSQLKTQRHRGPNADGWFESPRGVIAQNRLSIIDLVTGDPPMTNEDATIGAVLNGEIYNFGELRGELMRDGHALSSKGDTEVLAHLAEKVMPDRSPRQLDGMFAFATWDKQRERLMLGRDRTGKKPLHYWYGSGTFVFASEIKGVLAHPAGAQGAESASDLGLSDIRLRANARDILRRSPQPPGWSCADTTSRAVSQSSSATGVRLWRR